MRATGFLALFIALPTIAACAADGPDASVSGVFPSSAFLGRTMRVEVSGDVTSWKAGTAVDFGAGIAVESVAVASPTALFANIKIADDAEPGLRDVTVSYDGDTQVLVQAFQLEPAVTIKFRGSVAQGSIAAFTITGHDFDTPFDTTATGDGFFTPLEYTNTYITTPAGVTMNVGSVQPYSISGTAFFDLDAAPGAVVVNSGPEGEAIVSGLGSDLAVQARTATALVANTATPGNVGGAFESTLYEFTPTGSPTLATFLATSSSQAAEPGLALLPASGKFADMLSYGAKGAVVQEVAGKMYAIYFDNGGGSGYNYSVKANSQMMTAIAEAEPNNTIGNAPIAAATPYLVTGATLSSVTDADWVGINVATTDFGKKLRVLTAGPDPYTDTVVEIFKSNGTTTFGGPSRDSGFAENHTSPVLAEAGRYYVKVTASQDYFMDTNNQYIVAVWIE